MRHTALKMAKANLADKEKALLKKIKDAKDDLVNLQKKQKEEIGNLAYKYQLNEVPRAKLEAAFKKLKKELLGDNA